MKIVSATLATLVLVAACGGHVANIEDPSTYNSEVNCESACANLARLQCESGGATCVAFCNRVRASGYLSLPLNCITHAVTKQDARWCGARCSESE